MNAGASPSRMGFTGGGSAGDLLSAIGALDEKLERVMLFGHNPEFTGEVGPTEVGLERALVGRASFTPASRDILR